MQLIYDFFAIRGRFQCHLVKEIHIYFHIKNIIAKEKVILQRT